MIHARFVLPLVVALITGCGSTDEPVRAASTASETTVPPDPTTGPAAGPYDTDQGETEDRTENRADEDPDGAADLASCVVNRWTLLADQVEGLFRSTSMGAVPGFEVSVTGEGTVDIAADGTYRYEPSFSITESLNGLTGTGEWGGALSGTWTVTGDQLTMTQVDNAITGSISLMGTEIPMPVNRTFNGTATITDCQPMTLTTRMATPAGDVEQTLVG